VMFAYFASLFLAWKIHRGLAGVAQAAELA
jgi:hypothetical protein